MAGELPERNQNHEIAWPMPVLFEIFIIACGAIMKGLFIPGVTELGASSDSFPSGIVIPGANVMTLPPGEWVDLSDIDLTSSALDYRVSFSCASNHAYYSADGTIQFAAPDVWPLEYRNGVAVGRHEPERQSTNYMNSVHPENMTSAVAGSTLNRSAVISMLGLPTISAKLITPSASMSVYSLFGIAGGQPGPGKPGVVSVWISVDEAEPFTVYTNNETQFIPRQIEPGLQKIILRDALKIDYVMMGLRNVQASYTARMCGFQCEAGAIVTSPILANGTPTTRSAAFVTVKNPGGVATAMRISYSSGESDEISFNGADESQIPFSSTDWGKRYIQRIEYIR
ncbi:TPA: hypothetical protein N5K88_001825 [Enterobacter cloacae subsp. cloacae]|nr:hypothetical protein [Enterobacter cloacae subsp. cloacae]